MGRSILRGLELLACLLALTAPLLLLPIFVADADPGAAPPEAGQINQLLTKHDARYVMRAYSRVPLQCASELHGA